METKKKKSFCTARKPSVNEKENDKTRKNICKPYINKELISKIYKECVQLNRKKKKNTRNKTNQQQQQREKQFKNWIK